MIRITGGALSGRVLPEQVQEGVRPTAARVREAVFSMVGQDLSGWSMLDLFGGTGLMAIESASRGAAPVVCVEKKASTARAIRANVTALGAAVDVAIADASAWSRPADLVYLDPPFREPIADWLGRAAPLTLRVLVAEARAPVEWPEVDGFVLDRSRRYGDTAVAIYVRGSTG